MRILLLLCVLCATPAWADDVLCHDANGFLTERFLSVDIHTVGLADANDTWLRPECVRVTRETARAATSHQKVDLTKASTQDVTNPSGANYFQDRAVVSKTVTEEQADAAALKTIQDAAVAKVQAAKDELKAAGLSDATIGYLLSPTR